MRRRLTVTEMARNFSDYINRVAYRGERFLLTRGSRVVAEIKPVPETRRVSELPGLLQGLPRLGRDEADAFARDWRESREELEGPGTGGAWAS